MPLIWHITSLTVSLALLATAIVLPPAVLLAWVLARREFPGKTIVETVVSLPLVMPPVATGVLLLYLVGRRSAVGRMLAEAGIEILQGPESHENGKFAWLLDPEGNKVELWEPKPWDDKNKET